ncbi:MAG TPA: DUF2239 family protein [Geothrix sp.]|nr:DUF2239 family protein [Geothrix sp.]
MDDPISVSCTAFDGVQQIASGRLPEVALAVKDRLQTSGGGAVLVFDDQTGRVLDLDLRGRNEEVLARLAPPCVTLSEAQEPRGRGRPRLGVVPREVTLLPRHWDWLNAQPGGASVTLRKLVEEARRTGGGAERKRLAQERAYRFMSALGGDEVGFEEALRALYAGDATAFEAKLATWPPDVREHAQKLARPAFEAEG